MGKLEDAQRDRVVIGLKDITPGPVNRQDIDWLLLHQPDAFNVFIIALWELQQEKESSNWLGYNQLAGIHGLPKIYWDGVKADGGLKEKGNRNEAGYCAHATLNFGPWHRPYLALFEQSIYSKMTEVVERYPQRSQQKYRDAIKQWRLPYLDYHRPRGGPVTFAGVTGKNNSTTFPHDFSLPKVFQVEKLLVRTTAEDKLEPHPNPFASYSFPGKNNATRIPDDQWEKVNATGLNALNRDRTYRRASGVKDLDSLDGTLNSVREGQVKYIMKIMDEPGYDSYGVVGDQTRTDGAGASGSLEGIHGSYHGSLGGRFGHMGQVAVAAFDPIFWIHHCQVDRWFAIWQAIHPDSWFPEKKKSIREQNLLPFRASRDPEKFWKADGVRKPDVFGYSYPDLVAGGPDKVREAFKNKYQWSYREPKIRENFGPVPTDMIPWDVTKAQVYDTVAYQKQVNDSRAVVPKNIILPQVLAPTAAVNLLTVQEPIAAVMSSVSVERVEDGHTEDRAYVNIPEEVVLTPADTSVQEDQVSRQWFVDILVERLALNGAFGVYFFLGDFIDDPNSYSTQPTFAGQIYIFTASVETCDNCGRQDEQGLLLSDTLPINPLLLDYEKIGQLKSLEAVDVVEFLESQLKWRIVKSNGELVDSRSIASLKIGVSTKATNIKTKAATFEEYPGVIEKIVGRSS